MTTAVSVKLLFNQNLSYHLPRLLADLYPGAYHVESVGYDVGPDGRIWDYAGANGFTIVTKDKDYKDLSETRGHPPKVVLLRLGNCSVETLESLLRERFPDILALCQDEGRGLLKLP